MKYAQTVKGKRAERAAVLPLLNEAGEIADVPILVAPLTGSEETEVLEFASAYAAEHGAKGAGPTDPLYDVGFVVKSVQLGVLDPDSPAAAREPFFGSPEEVLELPPELRAYLYAILEDWQDSTSPSIRKVSTDQLRSMIYLAGKGGSESERFFDRLSPGMRRVSWLFMANLLGPSLEPKSGNSSETTTPMTDS